MYDISARQETQITTNSDNQTFPHIYDDKIVFEDDRNGNSEIYLITID